jgi:hypothetical protein
MMQGPDADGSFSNSGLITVAALFVTVHSMGRTQAISRICHKVRSAVNPPPPPPHSQLSTHILCLPIFILANYAQAFGNSRNPRV